MFGTAAIIILVFSYTQAQDADCDYFQYVTPNVEYNIYSPNYPNNYKKGVQCRWIATCPMGYNCKVECNVDIPQNTEFSTDRLQISDFSVIGVKNETMYLVKMIDRVIDSNACSMDRLLISKTGDPLLASADYYCGRGSVSAVSTAHNITLGLIASRYSPGGKFKCILTAQKSTDSSCTCGYTSRNRIVGGEETKPNEFPMMAGIVDALERTIKCGATIISHKYLLTAAHCVTGKAATELAVVVGEHDVSTGNDTSATRAFRVASYLVHPKYTSSNYNNDIAIVRVDGYINYSQYVGPVCLPFRFANWDFTGANVILLGWGTLFPGGPTSQVLRKVNVTVISQSTCRSSVPTVTPQQMCTFSRGKDACQYDSGGPALYRDPVIGSMFHCGIISSGRSCASNSRGVNTRITAFLNWIVQNAPDDYCRK